MSLLASELDSVPEDHDSTSSDHGRIPARIAHLAPWLLIAGLVLFHAINNWLWLTENVTLTGWDRPRHLAHSLNFARMLSPISIQSLFDVMVSDPVRPPIFPVSAAPLYWFFGWTSDVATMINVLYMAILLAATYGIGKRWAGSVLGMVSVVLLACFPMFYAMSRHFYLEFALTAMVALTVWLLLATSGFQRKGISLLFGLSLGLGLLTKRTFAVFAVGPVIAIILTSGILPALCQRLKQRPKIYWKYGLLALASGLALAALWYLPNRETVRTLILGDALFVLWWALAAFAIYFALLPSAPLANATASAFLAAALASTWYLARIEFVQRMVLYGYGVNDPRGRALQLDRLDTYLFYLRRLANEHISLVLFGLFFVVLAMATVVHLRQHKSVARALRAIRPAGWATVAWVAGAYVLLTFSIYQETRAFLPVLPAIALIFGSALLKLPWRRIRSVVFAFVVIFGLVQFVAQTFEPASKAFGPLDRLRISLPYLGDTSVFAQGGYLELPDEGQTDRDYWIQPDVLQRMEQQRQARGRDLLSLGLVARSRQINASAFIYLMLANYPSLRVEGLIDRFEQNLPYQRLFAHDYVAVKRLNAGTNPGQEETIQAILAGSSQPFSQAFELETTYALPDGDIVYLYRQRYYLPSDYPIEYVADLAVDLADRTRPGDAILLYPPELVGAFAANYGGAAQVYLAPSTEEELAAIAAQHPRLFMVVGDAEAFAPADPASGESRMLAQGWLNRHAFLAEHRWADSLQVMIYGTTATLPAAPATVVVEAPMGEQIVLESYELPAGPWQPGDIVSTTLFWKTRGPIAEDFSIFVHLLDGDGLLMAQSDSPPVGGSRPTSGWGVGGAIVDRHGLLLPSSLPPGDYELLVGMYSPQTGERLLTGTGDGQSRSDNISLGWISVTSP
jgi:4-amino-4-deoxy-L-arabinose transferase-like glycosyltransferase